MVERQLAEDGVAARHDGHDQDHGERDAERNQRRVLETQPCRERVREIRVFDEVIDPAPYDRDQRDERDRRREQEPCLLVIAISCALGMPVLIRSLVLRFRDRLSDRAGVRHVRHRELRLIAGG